MLKPFSLFALASLSLAACNTTQAPRVQATLSPAYEAKVLDIVAARIESNHRAGSIGMWKFRKTEISDAFWRGKIINEGPRSSYCVSMEPDNFLGSTLKYHALVDVTEKGPEHHQVEIQFFDGFAPPVCADKALHDYPKLMELREKRRAANPPREPEVRIN